MKTAQTRPQLSSEDTEAIARPIFDRYFHGGYSTNPERKAKEMRQAITYALGGDDMAAVEWIEHALGIIRKHGEV